MSDAPAATWLVGNADLLPWTGTALDVACGRGRNALWLGERGLRTMAIDRDAGFVQAIRAEALARHLPVDAQEIDLEAGVVTLGLDLYDVIVVIHYLHRPLFGAIVGALRPGGVLVYETFTRAQAARGKPTSPAFLLESGELQRLVAPLEVVRQREGDFDGRLVAGVIARRPL